MAEPTPKAGIDTVLEGQGLAFPVKIGERIFTLRKIAFGDMADFIAEERVRRQQVLKDIGPSLAPEVQEKIALQLVHGAFSDDDLNEAITTPEGAMWMLGRTVVSIAGIGEPQAFLKMLSVAEVAAVIAEVLQISGMAAAGAGEKKGATGSPTMAT